MGTLGVTHIVGDEVKKGMNAIEDRQLAQQVFVDVDVLKFNSRKKMKVFGNQLLGKANRKRVKRVNKYLF
jgi:hypothetical protein